MGYKDRLYRQQFQSLLGSLLYITKCIRPARLFLNRILHILRDNINVNRFQLPQPFYKDSNWFNTYLDQYNGTTFYYNKKIKLSVHLDASLEGLGAHHNNMVYALPLSHTFRQLHITQLEMLNVVVALKVWSNTWCNSQTIVEILNSGKTKDIFLTNCARNIWLITAMFNIQLKIVHVPGKYNQITDLLSRWTATYQPEHKLRRLLPNFIWVNTHIHLTALNLDI